ncbi:hypothetical protein VB005_06141 [Metarhizium brunneum]
MSKASCAREEHLEAPLSLYKKIKKISHKYNTKTRLMKLQRKKKIIRIISPQGNGYEPLQ